MTDAEGSARKGTPAHYEQAMLESIYETRTRALEHLRLRKRELASLIGRMSPALMQSHLSEALNKATDNRIEMIEHHFIEGMEGLLS